MRIYSSNEELFQHIRDLAIQLRGQGHTSAAQSLVEGLSSLNGLTDGWALLMEAIARAIQLCGSLLSSELLSQLNDVLTTVKKLVFR